MTYKPRILVFSGSLRKNSYNKKLAHIAAHASEKQGASVQYIDLEEYPMPLYDGDIEDSEGLPDNALKIKELLWNSDGFIIASPEHNSSISAALKNMIDWASRKASDDETFLSCFKEKVALLVSASPSPLGGLRGLTQLREILSNLLTIVYPKQKTCPNASEAFDKTGKLTQEKDQSELETLCKGYIETVIKLKS